MMNKKLLASLLALMMLLVLGMAAAEAPADAKELGEDGLYVLTAGMFEGPILLTSVGQSADVNIVNTLMTKAGIEVHMNPTAEVADLEGYKTLILAIGGSAKGLGAAGIDEHQELARVQKLIEQAKELEIKILSLHIGGSARRGVLSDMFIPDAIRAADAAIIVSEGDKDPSLVMRDLLIEGEIPAQYIEKQAHAIEPLKLLFTPAE